MRDSTRELRPRCGGAFFRTGAGHPFRTGATFPFCPAEFSTFRVPILGVVAASILAVSADEVPAIIASGSLAVAVPEAATALLFGFGLAGLGMVRPRRLAA